LNARPPATQLTFLSFSGRAISSPDYEHMFIIYICQALNFFADGFKKPPAYAGGHWLLITDYWVGGRR